MSDDWDALRAMPEATAEEQEAVSRALGVAYDWNENGDILALGVLRALREERESDREHERKAWARLVKAESGALMGSEEAREAARQALRDIGVDVDALLEAP